MLFSAGSGGRAAIICSMGAALPQLTIDDYERDYFDRHLLHRALAYWAERKPEDTALVHHSRRTSDSWADFDRASSGLAAQLLAAGFRKGDFLAVSLPFTREHILLEYACFKIGVIHVPLDLRLSPPEALRSLKLVRAAGYVFPGQTRVADFRELGRAVQRHCPFVRHLIQLSPVEETIDGARPFAAIAQRAASSTPDLLVALAEASASIAETDGAQVIFTTGSTGAPKPALLTHRSITAQNMCLGAAFFHENSRVLVNLPPSHVGGQAELLMTTLFTGATAVVLDTFDPAASLEAIQAHRVTLLGQIPAMFHLEWRLSNFGEYDLSSLETAVYGGQQVPPPFLDRMAAMAPSIGTGLGLTEASGFCTYTAPGATLEEVSSSLGHDMPAYRMSIRRPMQDDGAAGAPLPDGEVGAVCFTGPQTFAGYVNDPVATRSAISTDGILYTGDMGYQDAAGLHFSGRSKWVIKASGYQVFPGQVEEHFAQLRGQVAACGVVGQPHAIFGEGIVAFVEKHPGVALKAADLKRHARGLTGYMRPLHYVILEQGQLPLNRVGKTDYVKLSGIAREVVEGLGGRWNR